MAAAHSGASTAPRIDSLDTMSSPPRSPADARQNSHIHRQPELCSHGPRDQQDPNQTQPPGWSQIRRLEAQTHPHLPNLTGIRRRASQPKDFTGTAAWDTTRGFLALPEYAPLVPRETGQSTWVTHKSPPALSTDQAMNLFRDKTINLLNWEMRIARVCSVFEDGAGTPPKHKAYVQRIRTVLPVDPGSGAPAVGHATATRSREHESVPRETERVRPNTFSTPSEGRAPSSTQLLTTPPRT